MTANSTSFKPGQLANATSIKKGQTNNPGGRRKDAKKFAEFRAEMRELSPKAIQRCRDILEDDNADPSDWFQVIKHVHAYSWGQPPAKLEIEAPLSAMSDDELSNAIAALRTILSTTGSGVAVSLGDGAEASEGGEPSGGVPPLH